MIDIRENHILFYYPGGKLLFILGELSIRIHLKNRILVQDSVFA